MRVVISSLLVLELTACSLTSMERLAGTHRPESMPRCSASMMPVVADVSLSVFFGAFTANAVAIHERDSSSPTEVDDAGEMLRFGIPMAIVTAVSAWYGHRVRSRCIDARARHEAWVVDHLPPSPLLAPPPPPTPPASPPTPDAP